MAELPLIELRDIRKRFGQVRALAGVDFAVRRGEVHVLAGENGAGKTTLMNVLAGLYQPDAGEVVVRGRAVRITCPRDALGLGIGMVHQHFELVPPFSALENVLLGREGRRWWLDRRGQRRRVEALMAQYGLGVELDARVRDLSVGVQQKVEILKALFRGVDLLILDEPTTHLTPQEVDYLFATTRRLVERGLTVILITHKVREMLAIGDRLTVMRRGEIVGTLARAEATESRLIELLMGSGARVEPAAVGAPGPMRSEALSKSGELGATGRPPAATEVPALELVGVTAPGLRVEALALRAGELLGVAGVAGNGQRELAEVIVGLRPVTAGAIRLRGWDCGRASVRERILAGLAYVPEDRLAEGILPRQSLAESFVLGAHHLLFRGRRIFDAARARALCRRAIEDYRIVAQGPEVRSATLSGGNIQKALVARAVLVADQVERAVLVAMNPTRGLDIGTTEFVHRRLRELRERGKAVLLISEDLDELIELCDRIAVLYRGQLAGLRERSAFDPYRLGALMVGADGGAG